ncbi:hypothetical protein [Lusitaniella coriacea]|uniref:hypothetical protein n=1 Tax=Lusitaniella coriacea TaxID=1983105 RepID=UPI001D149748|nr:hypothetical protein [Lusitaniella coriacea]
MLLAPLPVSKIDRNNAFPQNLTSYSARIEALKEEQPFSWRPKPQSPKSPNAQLIPLTQKDLQVLDRLFDREDIEAINTDIFEILLILWPDPCWEDDPFEVYNNDIFDFLSDFL